MSAVTYVEATILTDSNRNPVLSRRFDDLLPDVSIQIESVTPGRAEIARAACRDFGKARHKAGLNFWDASPTRQQRKWTNRCSSRARILPTRMWSAPYHCC
jgi:uncharacterized protein with PIN domain